ncbi:MAG: hypothetical protein ABSG13_06535 [Bryobacteraceae bacterium]|jgi:hypothetical protein
MLTEKQYELIGRITIAFNGIDFVMFLYTNHFLGTYEIEIAERIGQSLFRFFAQRSRLFETVLTEVALRYPDLGTLIDAVKEAATEAEVVNKERTRIVHGLLIPSSTGTSTLRHGNAPVPCSEAELSDVLQRVRAVEDNLTFACEDLREALNAKRPFSH